jgi:hypothetical protein
MSAMLSGIIDFILNPGIYFSFNKGFRSFSCFDWAWKFPLCYQPVDPGVAESRSVFNFSKADKFI